MSNYHENLSKRIKYENENTVLNVKSITAKRLEILKKMYPNAEIVIQSKCPLCGSNEITIKSEIRIYKNIKYEYKWKYCKNCLEEYEDEELIDENLNRIRKELR